MPTVQIYTPMDYQMAVHNGLAAHWAGTIHVSKAVRQCGKSLMAENILLKCSLEHANQTSILISPTLSQSRKIFKEITRAISRAPFFTSSNGTDLEITFVNGSQILLKSAEQGDNLRGYTVTRHGILIIDEAAYIRDDIFFTVTPYVNANNAPILLLSTPRFRAGFFYDFYNDGMAGKPGVYSYDFTRYKNPFLTSERLELYRRKMSVNLFRADYLGEWMETTSDIFGDFARVLSNTATNSGDNVAGIDWGVGKNAKNNDSDSTALSIMNRQKQQIALFHWNDIDATTTIQNIIDKLRAFDVRQLIVESNSIGSVYLDLLRKEINRQHVNCVVRPFNTSNDTKRAIIEALQVAIQNGDVQLMDDPELKIQFSAYRMEKTPTGKITYNASPGYHDDIVIATALTLRALKTANYHVL